MEDRYLTIVDSILNFFIYLKNFLLFYDSLSFICVFLSEFTSRWIVSEEETGSKDFWLTKVRLIQLICVLYYSFQWRKYHWEVREGNKRRGLSNAEGEYGVVKCDIIPIRRKTWPRCSPKSIGVKTRFIKLNTSTTNWYMQPPLFAPNS